MSFSASTCLTYTGTTTLGDTLYVFSNVDSFSTYFTTIPLSAITGNNCPYLITGIPDFTTTIRLQDYLTGCCVDIPIQCSDFCTICDLNFTLLSASTVSQIVAGNLTGSCENITDYVVYWYGPDSLSNIGYISGSGSLFSYQFPHPLTGTSAIFAQAGTYTPIIDRIKISGYTFSQTGGTGNYLANLDCFSPVTVEPLTCDNGNQPTSAYTHFYSFSGASQGIASPPLQATFELSANTNYFAWKFRGFSVTDIIRFSYSGSNYSVPLVLDNTVVGDNLLTSNTTWTNYTKSADTAFDVQRVICLTGLTRSPGNENILIDLIPNSGLTNWQLSVACLDFDCSKCTDNYLNQPYKIILSGVTALTYNSSDVLVNDFSASCYSRVRYSVSGCTTPSILNTDFYNYFQQSGLGLQTVFNRAYDTNGIIGVFGIQPFQKLYYGQTDCDEFGTSALFGSSFTCSPTDFSSTITYSKYVSGTCPTCVGVLYFEFNQIDDLNTYYSSYQNAMSANSTWGYSGCTSGATPGSVSGLSYNGATGVLQNQGPFSGGTSINNIPSYLDNTDNRYYRHLWLGIPTATGSTICGQNTEGGGGGFPGNFDSQRIQGLAIHPSSIVSTGITGSNYYLQIIMNTVQWGSPLTGCSIDCTALTSNEVFLINNYSTATTYNFTGTTNTGSLFTNPFVNSYGIQLKCTTQSGYTQNGWVVLNDWSNKTLPFSSSTAPLYAYSAVTCPAYGEVFSNLGTYQYLFDYEVRLLNGGSTDFEIWAKTITNGSRSSLYSVLALQYSSGTFTYTNPTYVIT